MSKDSTDFQSALNYIFNIENQNINKDIELQENILDSDKFNISFNQIEKDINYLYECSRYIDDIIKYSYSFINENIQRVEEQCSDTITEIESIKNNLIKDNNKKSAYLYKCKVDSFNNESEDRDKKKLPSAVFLNNRLTMPTKQKIPIHIYDKDINNQSIILSNNILEKGATERKVYNITPSRINQLDIKFNNVTKYSVKCILENHTVKEVDLSNFIGMMDESTQDIVQLIIDMDCLNYKKIDYVINKNIRASDFWISMKERIYERNLNIPTSLEVLDIAGTINYINEIQSYQKNLARYNEAYNNYLRELTNWEISNKTALSPIFDLEEPSLHSDLQVVSKFMYTFGINSIDAYATICLNECCVVSDYIDISNQNSVNNEVSLESTYYINNGSSIEFYLQTATQEYPILPNGESVINNEKIFLNTPLRFEIDKSENYIIIGDGKILSISVEEAIKVANNYDNIYITYKTKNIGTNSLIKLNEERIKLKTIIRYYDNNYTVPYYDSSFIKLNNGDDI